MYLVVGCLVLLTIHPAMKNSRGMVSIFSNLRGVKYHVQLNLTPMKMTISNSYKIYAVLKGVYVIVFLF